MVLMLSLKGFKAILHHEVISAEHNILTNVEKHNCHEIGSSK